MSSEVREPRDKPANASAFAAWLARLFPASGRDWLGVFGLAVLYAGCAVLSLRWAVVPGAGAAFWPAAGIALAALILWSPRLWLGAVLGRLLAFWIVGAPQPLWAQLVIAVATALGALLPVLALPRLKTDARLETLRSALWLVIVAAGVGALISASAGAAMLWAGGASPAKVAQAFISWLFGFVTGVLTFAPVLLAWRPPFRRWSPRRLAHLAGVCLATTLLAILVFLQQDLEPAAQAWFIFPLLVWAALAFDARGASIASLLVSLCAFVATVRGVGPFLGSEPTKGILVTQQFVGVMASTTLILAAVAHERRGREALEHSEQRYKAERDALSVLNDTGAAIAAELDLDRAVQVVTDAGVTLTGARFGAFFYRTTDTEERDLMLYALSGAPRSAFETFGHPRMTSIFAPTFEGRETVRSDDIVHDPRYGHMGPHHGMPEGHLPVRSYLAVPVRSRSSEVVGGLFFGHPDPGVFDARAERLAEGVAAHAAIALDNARLYQSAQRELEQRRRAERHQRLLINELNHRVKNTLATVQSLGAQTLRSSGDLKAAREAFEHRLIALSGAHDLLTRSSWSSADLADLVDQAAAPFQASQFHKDGPAVRLPPSVALALSMALHELATNAVKYGALSTPAGRVRVTWRRDGDRLAVSWREDGGPPVSPPARKGFGSRLIAQALARELRGEVRLDYAPDGVLCEIAFPLDEPPDAAPPFDLDA